MSESISAVDPFPQRNRTADLLPFRHRTVRTPTGQRRYDQLVADIATADTQLSSIVERRRQLARQLDDLVEAYWPIFARMQGYKPPVADELPFPDAHDDAEALTGSRLRSVLMTLLRTYGACRLRTLHALVLHHGFTIGSPRPVKTLADALNHEVHRGRATRIERGVYATHRDFHPKPGRFGNVALIPATPWVTPRLTDDLPSPIAWT